MKVAILAGDISADVLGAQIAQALITISDEPIALIGVGRDHLHALGQKQLRPNQYWGLAGVAEVLTALPTLFLELGKLAAAIEHEQPDLVITIDAFAFMSRVVKRLPSGRFRLVHVVAPSVRWRSRSRAKTLVGLYDGLLTLWSYEPSLFPTRTGFQVIWVGMPATDILSTNRSARTTVKRVGVFVGSRERELALLGPVLVQAACDHAAAFPEHDFVVIAAPGRENTTRALLRPLAQCVASDRLAIHHYASDQQDEKMRCLQSLDLAMAATGTIASELTFARVPHIVALRLHWLTALVVRWFTSARFIHPFNLIAERLIVPEFFQSRVSAPAMAQALAGLATDHAKRTEQLAQLEPYLEKERLHDGKSFARRSAEFCLQQCQ